MTGDSVGLGLDIEVTPIGRLFPFWEHPLGFVNFFNSEENSNQFILMADAPLEHQAITGKVEATEDFLRVLSATVGRIEEDDHAKRIDPSPDTVVAGECPTQ